MIAHKSVAAASGEDWNQMFRDGGREGVRQEQQLWSGGWAGLGGGAGSGVARGTLGRTPGCPLTPILQGRHHYVCKLEQPNFSQIPESALCVGTIKYRAELGRYPERPPAGQKYVLAAPQAPFCCGLSMLAPLLAEKELP